MDFYDLILELENEFWIRKKVFLAKKLMFKNA